MKTSKASHSLAVAFPSEKYSHLEATHTHTHTHTHTYTHTHPTPPHPKTPKPPNPPPPPTPTDPNTKQKYGSNLSNSRLSDCTDSDGRRKRKSNSALVYFPFTCRLSGPQPLVAGCPLTQRFCCCRQVGRDLPHMQAAAFWMEC